MRVAVGGVSGVGEKGRGAGGGGGGTSEGESGEEGEDGDGLLEQHFGLGLAEMDLRDRRWKICAS